MKHKNESLRHLTIEAEVFHNVAHCEAFRLRTPYGAGARSLKQVWSLSISRILASAKTLEKNLHFPVQVSILHFRYAFKMELTKAVL